MADEPIRTTPTAREKLLKYLAESGRDIGRTYGSRDSTSPMAAYAQRAGDAGNEYLENQRMAKAQQRAGAQEQMFQRGAQYGTQSSTTDVIESGGRLQNAEQEINLELQSGRDLSRDDIAEIYTRHGVAMPPNEAESTFWDS